MPDIAKAAPVTVMKPQYGETFTYTYTPSDIDASAALILAFQGAGYTCIVNGHTLKGTK